MTIFCSIRKIVFTLFILTLSLQLQAQTSSGGASCATDEVHRHNLLKNPSTRIRQQKADEAVLNRIRSNRSSKLTDVGDYTVPVVVHIIHNNGDENISDTQILDAIQHLNDAFSNSGFYDTSLGVATGIHFCLAKQDESGNQTSGITRHQSSLTNLSTPSQDLALKNIVRWNPQHYLNIWIVKEITSESAGSGVAGYAYLPFGHGAPEDGIVCEANYFGYSPDNSKIMIHEAGHYLGLYHTFEGACTNNDCLTDGDRVCDTPPDATSSPYNTCLTEMNSCHTDEDDPTTNNPFRPVASGGLGDQEDTPNNFMDYARVDCQIIFTEGQKERMIGFLTTLRSSLLESQGCVDLCNSPIQIAFTPASSNVVLNSTVNFNNTTTGATSFEWQINGVKFSEDQNPSFTFTQQGSQEIKLIARNSDIVCRKESTIFIQVECNTQALFTGPEFIKPTETVTFTNTTTGALSSQWFIDGTMISTDEDLTHIFPSIGGFAIKLVTYNGNCYDTSATKFVRVASCNTGNQGTTWFFGRGGGLKFHSDNTISNLSFNYTTSLPLIGHTSDEGCVSMCDANGNHMFFANPAFVYNRNKQVMPNGSGLLGDWSASQIAAAVHPSDGNIIYLFTLDALGNPNGVHFSVINMTLDNGLGDVVAGAKNIPLFAPASEKITTVKHANGMDTWVIAHAVNSNAYHVYLVDASGVNPTPVISNAGTVIANYGIGHLKASPDGCKLAAAIHDVGVVEILNFNNQTGEVSSPITISGNEYLECYGVEFSPDGSKLYIGTEMTKKIYQFDLNKTTDTEIKNSVSHIGTLSGIYNLGAFQIAPNGKIYIGINGGRSLGVINNPNAKGSLCEFVENGVTLGQFPISSTISLPSFTQNYFYNPTPVITGPDTVCVGRSNVLYRISHSTCGTDVNVWSLTGKGNIVSSNDTSAIVDFADEEGIDTIIVNRNSPCGATSDTMFVVIKNSEFDIPDTVQCSADPVILDATSEMGDYEWQDHSTNQTFSASSPGKYWVTVITPEGCTMTDTIRVYGHSHPDIDLGPDLYMCPGGVAVVNAGSGYITYQWQDLSMDSTYTVYQHGKYWVTVTDDCGVTDSDTISVLPASTHEIDLGTDIGLCPGESATLVAGSDYENYYWQNGASGNQQTVAAAGVYWVLGINSTGCFGYGELSVYEKPNCCDKIDIPTLITPNKDGLNDKFVVGCVENKGYRLEIYNRWGKAIYLSDNYNNDWAGNNVSEGIYFYLLTKDDTTYRGWVQVTR